MNRAVNLKKSAKQKARRHELMVKERMRRMRGTGTGSASGKRGYEDDEVVAVRGVGSRMRVKNFPIIFG
ncbi:hypothetical protein HK101_007037 [Irineochytrium annulatum]|nr:hypothetical protein HK101_007037 [Irineochytrium annulatum]